MNLFKRFKQSVGAASNSPAQKPSLARGNASTSQHANGTDVQNEKPVFNQDGMLELLRVCSSPALFERLLELFTRDRSAHLEQLRVACVQQDYALWRKTLHDLKGSAYNLRLERLADTAIRAHAISLEDFAEDSSRMLQELHGEYRQAEQALYDALPGLMASV